jgi:hypothetical protein
MAKFNNGDTSTNKETSVKEVDNSARNKKARN